jgi:hypothetical protein
VAKDRAAPFSRKHRKTWIPITGGMILIGIINLSIGLYLYSSGPKDAPRTPKHDANPFSVDAGIRDGGIRDGGLPAQIER